MITKTSLFDQYCIIEEVISDLNAALLHHLNKPSPTFFSPNSLFIAQVVMVHYMMLHFVRTVEENDWADELYSLYQRTRKHLLTTEIMLQDLICSSS